MNPIETRDKEILKEEFLSGNPLVTTLIISILLIWLGFFVKAFPSVWIPFVLLMINGGYWYYSALNRAKLRVFDHKGYELLWNNIKDREARFSKVLDSVRAYRPDDFESLKQTVEYTSKIVFQALRRADLINSDIGKTERALVPAGSLGPNGNRKLHRDEEVQLLYRTADKNIAEYKIKMEALEQGMQRSEGQAAVYATMLDTLRLQLLGHKLLGKPTSSDTEHFMSVIEEAKAQLRSVDEALEELDFESLSKQEIPVIAPTIEKLVEEESEPLSINPPTFISDSHSEEQSEHH